MRAVLALVVLAGVAQAGTRKPLSDKYTRAAGAAFEKARAADAAGRRGDAIAFYTKALEIVAAPEVAFNLAEVQYEAADYDHALENYDLYLALAPDATDRASVEKTIAEIERMQATLVIEPRHDHSDAIDLAEAYVFIDGVQVHAPGKGSPSVRVPVTALHTHKVDVVTLLTQYLERGHADRNRHDDIEVWGPPRIDGNVVVSLGEQLSVYIGGTEVRALGGRVALKPGRHRIAIADRYAECSPITLDVPAGDAVLYVYIRPTDELLNPPHCRALTVVQKVLAFK